MQPYLRDRRPGYEKALWHYTPELAKLPHMIPCDGLPEAPKTIIPPKTEAKPSRVPDIVAVIGTLVAEDFVATGVKAGYPKVQPLTELLGWLDNPVTGAERDEAWAIFQKDKPEA